MILKKYKDNNKLIAIFDGHCYYVNVVDVYKQIQNIITLSL